MTRFTTSAFKWGYTESDAWHALRHYRDVFVGQGALELTVFIGPTDTGELIEVGVELDADGGIERVAHMMRVRPKYLRRKRG